MATKLGLWNAALLELGTTTLSDTGEPVTAGRALTHIYDRVVAECLAVAPWAHGMETLAAEADTGPSLGYTHVFIKPSDWVSTEALAKDTTFADQLFSYYEDRRFWAADTGQINARYVSNDTGRGMELAKWPASYTRYVELELAVQACERLTQGRDLRKTLEAQRDEAKKIALERDVFQEPWPTFTAGTSRASVIHSALIEIANLGKISVRNVDARRIINRVYDEVVAHCLSVGSWNFAMETIQADADTGVTPNFGYTEVFAKPSDYVRTIGISADENFSFPLLNYYDDQNFWSADQTPIYVRYVSDDTGLGLEMSRWPMAFRRYVELELAARSCTALTREPKLTEKIEQVRDKARRAALNQDSMNEPNPKFAPPSSWTLSRQGRGGGDRGNRGSLIG